ncbi:hypothetical protein D2V05_10500 [Flagellimonas pelagia]|nr:hypothetical protein D2V05_10500 [Allomuricauda maritima]
MRDRPLTDFDLSKINKIIISNRGYNGIPDMGDNAEITDLTEINNLIDLFKNSEQLADGIIASNKGYIKLKLQKTDGKNITISNFYSNNGQIILLEDDNGISRFRNDKFFEEVQNILIKKGVEHF